MGVLDRRSATENERPLETIRKDDDSGVQPLCAKSAVALFVFFEARAEGAERVAEETVLVIDVTRSRRGADVMRGLVVIDENRAGRKIGRIIRMRQCHPARRKTDKQEDRNASPLNPRLRAEHPI